RRHEFRSRSRAITLGSVQALIPAGAALVELAVYTPFDPRGRTDEEAHKPLRYAACVLTREGHARWQDLGLASDIDRAVDQLRQALRDPKSSVHAPARALDRMVMQPLGDLLGGATRLLIAPDGELNLVPFEALVDD